MAYYVYAYLVDLSELQQVYGSHDLARLHTLFEQYADALDYADDEVEGWNAERQVAALPPVLNVSDALERIVFGAPPVAADEYFSYAWAYKILCAHLGTQLPNEDGFDYMSPLGVRYIEREHEQIAQLVFRSGPPPPITLPNNDDYGFIIGHLTPEEAARYLAVWRPVIISSDPIDSEWGERVCEQYRTWLSEAVRTQRGIVTFYS